MTTNAKRPGMSPAALTSFRLFRVRDNVKTIPTGGRGGKGPSLQPTRDERSLQKVNRRAAVERVARVRVPEPVRRQVPSRRCCNTSNHRGVSVQFSVTLDAVAGTPLTQAPESGCSPSR